MHACTKKVQELFEHFRVGHYSRQIMSNSEKPRTFLNFFLCTLPFLTSYYFSKKMKIATQQNRAFRAITAGFQRSNWTLSGPRLTKTMTLQIKTMTSQIKTMMSQFLLLPPNPGISVANRSVVDIHMVRNRRPTARLIARGIAAG